MVTKATAALATEKKSPPDKKAQQSKPKETAHHRVAFKRFPDLENDPMSQIFNYEYSKFTELNFSAMDYVKAARRGLPGKAIRVAAETLQIPMGEVYSLLHITPRTAQRMMNSEKLDVDASDHLLQLLKIYKRCLEVFQDREKTIRWLKTANFALGDQTPLSLLDTTDGLELVAKSLIKIEYGVFG